MEFTREETVRALAQKIAYSDLPRAIYKTGGTRSYRGEFAKDAYPGESDGKNESVALSLMLRIKEHMEYVALRGKNKPKRKGETDSSDNEFEEVMQDGSWKA